jgi:hypothetical protein
MIIKGILKKDKNGFYLETKYKFNGKMGLNDEQIEILDTLVNKKIKIEYETINTIGNRK